MVVLWLLQTLLRRNPLIFDGDLSLEHGRATFFVGKNVNFGVFMVLVEGLDVQVQRIPRRHLASVWKMLSDRPFPKIKALKLSDDDFNHVLAHRQCPEDCLREVEEWGRVLSIEGTDACVFNADGGDGADYVILVRQTPYHSLAEIIHHELSHIARGDL